MTSAVCTLFEGNYHYGLAALTNSLHQAGFQGNVYAGFRGMLPPWAKGAARVGLPGWPEAQALQVQQGLKIVFLPLSTEQHLTNYKADFMLALFDGPARNEDALFYLDPDICVVCPWRYLEEWVSCGVALCEDVNSPLPEHHPRRVGWRRYYGARGLPLRFRSVEYVNGGFVGVAARDLAFLHTWRQTMQLMAEEIGSLGAAKVERGQAFRSTGFANCFDCSDQDALNAAVEASELGVSVIGQEVMGFKPGSALLPHAVGSGKPWQRNYVRSALRGMAPRAVDRAFWAHAAAPIAAVSSARAVLKRLDILAGAAIGQIVRRA